MQWYFHKIGGCRFQSLPLTQRGHKLQSVVLLNPHWHYLLPAHWSCCSSHQACSVPHSLQLLLWTKWRYTMHQSICTANNLPCWCVCLVLLWNSIYRDYVVFEVNYIRIHISGTLIEYIFKLLSFFNSTSFGHFQIPIFFFILFSRTLVE